MSTISCFTNLDSLFDPRRGIITKVALESGNTKFNWNTNMAEVYKRRRYDYFNQPELGITQEKYEARYAARTINDFADETQCYFYPSKLIRSMFRMVREVEFGVGQMLSVSTFSVTVNLYPYTLTTELLDELESVIRGAVPFNISLSFVKIPYDELTPSVLNGYQYVFIYDFLIGKDYKVYWENYAASSGSTVKFFVPDMLVYKELPEEMRREEPIETIGKLNVTQGGKITWVPCLKTIFDYSE
ncbi:hypothetical protein AH04_255 [Erwinia phage AH04]|uniref:Uncharacterized protein n=1 Tax=Erwinia phage AH04 TaxID=2869569 RepID=A0AAE7X144_9CAUD|nr:hypothetical protein PQC02_gp059 [Erwinia phage AH04]QZA70728.1 hypothetical protein AH04_255 [Erwinia phage AH04]